MGSTGHRRGCRRFANPRREGLTALLISVFPGRLARGLDNPTLG
jgi:hypothetical protein